MHYWTLKQLVEAWQVSDPTLRRWIRDGRLIASKAGRGVRISDQERIRFEATWTQGVAGSEGALPQAGSEVAK